MEMNISVSNNKEFNHDSSLEDDFNYNYDYLEEGLEMYLKYKLDFSFQEEFDCRESLLSFLKTAANSLEIVYLSVGLEYATSESINHRLVNYFYNNCKIAKKCIRDFYINDTELGFEVLDSGTEYYHFISLLILLCDENFKRIYTRTKVNEIWVDKTKEEIFTQIVALVSMNNEWSFDVNCKKSLIGYIKTVLIDNKLINSNHCNGPETAFELGKIID
jgi:hypothetical protein